MRPRRVNASELVSGHPTRTAIEQLIRRWLRARPMAPMGFLVRVHLFEFADPPFERAAAFAFGDEVRAFDELALWPLTSMVGTYIFDTTSPMGDANRASDRKR